MSPFPVPDKTGTSRAVLSWEKLPFNTAFICLSKFSMASNKSPRFLKGVTSVLPFFNQAVRHPAVTEHGSRVLTSKETEEYTFVDHRHSEKIRYSFE